MVNWRYQTISRAALSIAFLAILILPLAESIWHFAAEIRLPENRKPQDYPKLEWTAEALASFPTRFEAAFNDNFGFRAQLIRWQAIAKYYWLNMSPSQKVILGRDGWLYYRASMNEHRGIQRLPKAKVKAWLTELQSRKALLDARRIQYLIVVAPNKETIYPEFLPQDIQQVRKKLWLDDLLEAVTSDVNLDILDLREALLAAKSLGRVYHRTDSHWNALGVKAATNAILARLSSRCPGIQLEQIGRTHRIAWGKSGDLARLMGLEDSLQEEVLMIMPPDRLLRPTELRYKEKVGGVHSPPVAVESFGVEGQCSVMIAGDSFSDSLNGILPVHFRRTVELRPFFPYHPAFQRSLLPLIDAEKPDVYVELLVDRDLFHPPEEGSSTEQEGD